MISSIAFTPVPGRKWFSADLMLLMVLVEMLDPSAILTTINAEHDVECVLFAHEEKVDCFYIGPEEPDYGCTLALNEGLARNHDAGKKRHGRYVQRF